MKRIFVLTLCVGLTLGLMGCGTGAAAPTPSATPTPSTVSTPSASSEDYTEIAITVAGNPDLPLSGLLTLPAGAQKPPVVILVQGSGATDMDETIGSAGNKPFRDIAQGLAEAGIASIRYDKRYFAYPQYGQSLGSDVTVEDEVLEDVSAAIALAQADERVDGSRVYVLGHSMGGMLVPKIADMHPELAGLISVAGSLRQLWDIIYDQNMELVETLRPTLSEADSKTLDAQLDVLEDNMAVLNGDLDAVPNDTTLLGIPAGYWKSLKASNGMRYLDACSMPMLIMQGDADFQVYPQIDYQLWVDTMGDWDNVTCRLYEGLNHLMMPTAGLRSVEEYNTAAQVDPQVISDISAFVLGE